MTYALVIETNGTPPNRRILNVDKRNKLDDEFNHFKMNFDYINEGRYYIVSAYALKIDNNGKATIYKTYK